MAAAREVPTATDILNWPVTVDVPTAGRCFGLGRDVSYDLARTGQFPTPVLRLGRSLRVTRAALLGALGVADSASAAPSNSLAKGQFQQVPGSASDSRSEAHGRFQAA